MKLRLIAAAIGWMLLGLFALVWPGTASALGVPGAVPQREAKPPKPCAATKIMPWYNAPQDRKARCLPDPKMAPAAPAGTRFDVVSRGPGKGAMTLECQQSPLSKKHKNSRWVPVTKTCKK